MGYTDNPFAPVTDDERIVMHHLKTVLNRLSPDIQKELFSELTGARITRLEEWESEHETGDSTPESAHLIGLSKHPPVDGVLELGPQSGGGPVDLYSEKDGVGVAIEGKTKGSLRDEQLSRYATTLNTDSYTTASWSDLYRLLSEFTSDMRPYPAGLVDEFLDYLEHIELHQPHQVARYVWGESDGVKRIRVEEGENGLTVSFKVEATEGQGKKDERVLSWDEFCELFDDVESRHGREFIRRVFVDGEPPFQQPELDGDTVLGQIDPIRPEVEDENYLRLNFHEDNNVVKLRTVRPSEGGTVGSPYSPYSDGFVWYVEEYELPETLERQPNLPGFDPEFREMLFLERDDSRVKSNLW